MGLINFVKSVGEKLGIGSDQPQADQLKTLLDSFKLGADKVDVKVDGDKAILSGEVKDHTILEKAALAIGNSLGIAAVDTDGVKVSEAAAAPATSSRFYEVKKGDNLWKIAEEVYGKGQGAKNTLIFEANKPMLKSPDKIYPGQLLRIPPVES